jgi:hypothetical protein
VDLLEKALRASGGMDIWRLTRRFTLHMSITGSLCSTRCSTAQLKELVVEGSTHSQDLAFTGFARADQRAFYRPDAVALEGPDGRRLKERRGSSQDLRSELLSMTWDELQLAYYCGYLIWNHIATPFILQDPDFETKELPRRGAGGERLRRLGAVFPARIVTHASVQTFYFDSAGFLRRLDYPAGHDNDAQIAQTYSGHQRFSGILVPTLCRLLNIGVDGALIAKPSLLDVEIFDAKFG